MKNNKCRVCNTEFLEEPLLKYENMPAIAQNLPDLKSLKKDKGINLEIYQCAVCGLVQLNNPPVPYYKDVLRASSVSEEMKKFRIKQFDNFIKKYNLKNKDIIEIGCGKGEYLSLIKKEDITAYGLENLESSVRHCIKNDLKVLKGFIEKEEYKIKNSPFDAFFTFNYLEHLPNPNSFIKGICNNIKKEGVGIIEVPNFDMILRKNLFSEFTADHLFYFTKETLNKTLMRNGFEIIECGGICQNYILSAIVRKSKESNKNLLKEKINKINLSPFYKHQLKLKEKIEKYVSKFKDKDIAIWGAGHQAFAIISLMNLSEKVRYVVDSASFKQGKYTPATHLPIVSPNELEYSPVSSIIVMAGSYSDEITKIINEKYGKKFKVSILRAEGLEKVI